ncbi:MAG: 3-dehydroquinate synthase [Candidatus Omnitrophica bacterium]|nr:3-dehydroquinate synthase [Candidatus Omnitrophota bacterium]
MHTVKVDLKDNNYNIVIGNQILKDLGTALKPLKVGTDAIIITNPVIKRHHGGALAAGLRSLGMSVKFIEVPSGEESKSVDQAFKLIEEIAAYDVKKQIFIIGFGGGVIGDLAGFIAAVYKRGIPFVQVPTTLLAQVDSAIGGKVAIDLPVGKNLVGAFYQPKIVWSDVSVLSTLDKRQIQNGLAEVVKYGIICDRPLFDLIERNIEKLLTLDSMIFVDVIQICSRIKAKVVMSDEKETQGMRVILNFGHTIGHAIEAANQFKDYHHGEAVALGMRVAVNISFRMGLISPNTVPRVDKVLSDIGLPEKIEHVHLSDIMRHMEHDKKFKEGKNRFVLATGIGGVKVVQGVDQGIIQAAVKDCM